MQDFFANIAQEALTTAFWATLPILGTALVVGLVVNVFQAVTSLQEPTLTFVPKIAAVAAAIFLFGPFVLDKLEGFLKAMIAALPGVTG